MSSSLPPTAWLNGITGISKYCGVSKRTVSRWIADGEIRVRHLSSRKIVCHVKDADKAILALSDRYEMQEAS